MLISVIIPTIDEEDNIRRLLDFFEAIDSPLLGEVLVVDGGSCDGTREIVAKSSAKLIDSSIRSRAAQMNHGAREAKGDVLYFVHADVHLVSSFAEDIRTYIDMGYDAGCYKYHFDRNWFLLKLNGFFSRFGGLLCRGGDQTLFISHKKFDELGGFDEYYTVMEDYDMVRKVLKTGRFKVVPKFIRVSARKYDTNSWLQVQFANAVVMVMYLLGSHPDKMKRLYHRMLDYRQ